jgi:hypothetical protein
MLGLKALHVQVIQLAMSQSMVGIGNERDKVPTIVVYI